MMREDGCDWWISDWWVSDWWGSEKEDQTIRGYSMTVLRLTAREQPSLAG